MLNQAKELMKQREVMISQAVDVLSVLGHDMNNQVVTKTVEVEKIVEKEVIKEVEDLTRIKELENTIELLKAEITKKDAIIAKLQAKEDVVSIEKEIVKEETMKERLDIHASDDHAVHGYYVDENGIKTPFTCGKKTSRPIVYGKDKMVLSDKIGQMLVDRNLVKKHKADVAINTLNINIKGKDLEMIVYRDKTNALVGAIEQRCAFIKHEKCNMPLVTQMKSFIEHGVHQLVDENGNKTPIVGYQSTKTHKEYVHAIAAALAKFEQQEKEEIERLVNEEETAYDPFNVIEETSTVNEEEDIEALEAAYFAKMAAEFGI